MMMPADKCLSALLKGRCCVITPHIIIEKMQWVDVVHPRKHSVRLPPEPFKFRGNLQVISLIAVNLLLKVEVKLKEQQAANGYYHHVSKEYGKYKAALIIIWSCVCASLNKSVVCVSVVVT